MSTPAPPSPEEMAAIVAAYDTLWPRPVVASAPVTSPSRWRFSGRWWSDHPARRRARP